MPRNCQHWLPLSVFSVLATPATAWALWGPGSLTLNDMYGAGLTGTIIGITLVAALSVAAAAAVFFSGGAATPVVASVGSFIGQLAGLSGAAATNYGLAMVGGGALAAGGFGVAGGAAVLTALFTFAGNMAVDYAINFGLDSYNEAAFKEASKNAVILPFPERENGDSDYNKILERLNKNYNVKEPKFSVENRAVVAVSLRNLKHSTDQSIEGVRKNALRALLDVYADDYQGCRDDAESAAQLAASSGIPDKDLAFLTMVRALCVVGLPQTDRSGLKDLSELYHRSVDEEINGKFRNYANIFVASFFDRYMARDDLMSSEILREALSFMPLISDAETKYTYFLLIGPRYNAKLNAYRSMISSLYENRTNPAVMSHSSSRKDMEYVKATYLDLLSISDDFIHYANSIDPSRNFIWGTRWYHEDKISEQASALKLLSESLKEHQNREAEIEMQSQVFAKASTE